MNIPAVIILGLLTRGADPRHQGVGASSTASSSSSRSSIVLMVIGIGWGFINPANHTPLIPAATTYTTPQGVTHNYGGIMGILGAAGVVFFAYIGFDAVSTAAQEAKNPKRDMPIGILGSLVVCTVLYVLFSYVLSGVATVEDFRTTGPRSLGGLRHLEVHARLRVAVARGHGGDSRRLLVGHPGDAARAVARLLLDEPATAWCRRSSREVHPTFRTPYKSNMLFFVFTALFARVRSRRHRRRDDQHRDAVRVHAGLRRRVDHARAPARAGARLHGAGAAGGGDARHRGLRRDDLRARLDQLAAADRAGWPSGWSSTSPTGGSTASWRLPENEGSSPGLQWPHRTKSRAARPI